MSDDIEGLARAARLPFSESLGFLVRDVNRAVQRELGARVQEHGVALGAWYILRVLWESDDLTQRDLAQRVGMTEPTAVIALRGIEAQGWIFRRRSELDQRKIHIRLTAAGRELRERMMPVAHEVNALIGRGLTEDEASFLRALLRRVRANFPSAGQPAAHPPTRSDDPTRSRAMPAT